MFKQVLPAATLLLLAFLPGRQSAPTPAPIDDAPTYTAKGDLNAPTRYREWVYLTSGLDMSYTASAAPADMHMFDNVFVNPSSWRSFHATGTWPDKTTLVLEIRGAQNSVSINKRGHTQAADIMGEEIHVKDHGVWSFYDLPAGATTASLIARPASCYTCHESHAAVDTTFVQFYPTLLPIAQQKHTLSPAYLKEIAAPVAPTPAK
jgi:hypothetical protein